MSRRHHLYPFLFRLALYEAGVNALLNHLSGILTAAGRAKLHKVVHRSQLHRVILLVHKHTHDYTHMHTDRVENRREARMREERRREGREKYKEADKRRMKEAEERRRKQRRGDEEDEGSR